jgi:hypothetical protein
MFSIGTRKIPPLNPAQLHLAYQHPAALQAVLSKEESYKGIWDSGVMCISYNKDDFVGPMNTVSTISWLKGIEKGLKIKGQGHVLWGFHDTHKQLRFDKNSSILYPELSRTLVKHNVSSTNLP